MNIPFIQDIVVILGLSVVVLLLFQKVRIPTIVGFLITGAIAGPTGLSLITVPEDVEILAEVGVILLLFLIGIEFSISHLSASKNLTFIGGTVQVTLTVLFFALISGFLSFNFSQSLFIGFLFSLSSTAIVLKLLQDKGEINSPHGKISLSVLIFQDIIVVPMMLVTPFLAGGGETRVAEELLLLLIKAIALVAFVILAARFLVPWLLFQIAKTKSRELFILTIVVICFAVAWLSSSMGLSLALGAFLAGLIISESEYSYEATANIIPFRELFTSFFFVSIGMLLDLDFFWKHLAIILLFTFITFLIKGFVASVAAILLKYPLRTVVLTGLCLFQVGEFSFILSRTGIHYKLLDEITYQYFLSVSISTLLLTPFIIKYANNIYYSVFGKLLPDKSIHKRATLRELSHEKHSEELVDHLVIIGYGMNGKNVALAAKNAGIKYVIIELNASTVKDEKAKGEPIIYGDAVKSDILLKVNMHKARVAVIAISDPDATRRILSNIIAISTKVHTIIRTRFVQEMGEFFKQGADEVIPEEFETSIEIFTRVLHKYLVPKNEIDTFVRQIRADNYEMLRPVHASKMETLGIDLPDIDIASLTVQKSNNEIVGKKLAESHVRKKYGITIVAIKRDDQFLDHIEADTQIFQDDVLYVFGHPQKIYDFNQKIRVT